MQATTTSTQTHPHRAVTELATSLDDLATRGFAELQRMYGAAESATSLRAIDGTPKGRMLAVKRIERSPIGGLVRAFAASSAFVWDGKTFASKTDEVGTGINRVQIPGALGRQNLFPFETRFGRSEIDGKQALILDYDLPETPPWIRKIHDEVRLASPGLFFGPAMWKAREGATTLLWFALDTRGR